MGYVLFATASSFSFIEICWIMGRPKRIFKLAEENERGKIKVRSKTYAHHFRAARGAKTPTEVNDSMKDNGEKMISSNAPAKLIFDAVAPYRENFKGGLFWQYLVKFFTHQAKTGESYSLKDFMHQDLNKKYPMSGILAPLKVEIVPDRQAHIFTISVSYEMNKRFLNRNASINGIQFTFIGIFPDFKDFTKMVIPVVFPLKKLDDQNRYSFLMDIPALTDSCLLICKVEGCQDGIVSASMASKSMSVEMVIQL